jgi:hypothetical protein
MAFHHQQFFDRVATIILAIFGIMNWLAFGLHLKWMQVSCLTKQ